MEVIIMAQQNALSRRQFKETEFNGKDYRFNMQPGEFVATIDCKRWGQTEEADHLHDLCGWPQSGGPDLAPEPV
jgi:hypothetical protein